MLSKGFLELARKLIAADTVSSQGTQRAADLLESLWEHAGLPVRRQVVEQVHVNLLGGPGGGTQGPGGVLLVTHLDTVPPGPRERWQTDPWTLTERDGFLYGLGVADVKLDALCKAEAARRGLDPRDFGQLFSLKPEWERAHPRPRATLAEVADHVEHVREVAGVEHVGLGGDFDGTPDVTVGLEDVSAYPALFAELLSRGWTESDCSALAGGNLLRALRDAESFAARAQA